MPKLYTSLAAEGLPPCMTSGACTAAGLASDAGSQAIVHGMGTRQGVETDTLEASMPVPVLAGEHQLRSCLLLSMYHLNQKPCQLQAAVD